MIVGGGPRPLHRPDARAQRRIDASSGCQRLPAPCIRAAPVIRTEFFWSDAAVAHGELRRAVRACGVRAHSSRVATTTSTSPWAGFSRCARGEGAGAARTRDWAATCCRRRAARSSGPRSPCSRAQAAPRPELHSRTHRAAATLRGALRAARASLGRSRPRGGRRRARPARCRGPRGCRSILRAPRSRAAAIHSTRGRRAALHNRSPATRAAPRRCSADSDGATGRSASVAALL